MIDVDYTKLALDLTDARRAALTATNGENDGGTCNFDAAAIRIPGSNTAKVQQAFAKADLHATLRGSGDWAGYWLISSPVGGQGNLRTRAAEAIQQTLHERGWLTTTYYQLD
jgi:hypothetical protein